jgi:formate hydrogenlyase subunit 3/multisubunit Na+/H+ antiporter MnhD subunit
VIHLAAAALPPFRRSGRIVWATLAFMAGFAILPAFVSRWYLIPAMEASRVASGEQKRQLAAHAWLLLAIILFILISGILLTFRFGRYFTPRVGEKPKPTQYVDAWAESARRVSVPPSHDDDEDEDDAS